MSLHEKARRRLKFVTKSVLIIAMNGPESGAGPQAASFKLCHLLVVRKVFTFSHKIQHFSCFRIKNNPV